MIMIIIIIIIIIITIIIVIIKAAATTSYASQHLSSGKPSPIPDCGGLGLVRVSEIHPIP